MGIVDRQELSMVPIYEKTHTISQVPAWPQLAAQHAQHGQYQNGPRWKYGPPDIGHEGAHFRGLDAEAKRVLTAMSQWGVRKIQAEGLSHSILFEAIAGVLFLHVYAANGLSHGRSF